MAVMFASLIGAAYADDKQSIIDRIGDFGSARPLTSSKATERSSTAAYGSSVRFVVATDSTIQPGSFKDYGEVPVDFGGAENVAISINVNTADLPGITMIIAWAGPGEYFTVADLIKSSLSAPGFVGSVRVPVYGPTLKLVVFNDSKAAVTVRQLAVYAFVH